MTRRSGRLQGKEPSFAGEVDENDKVVGGGKRKAEGEAGCSSDEGDDNAGGWNHVK